jgi:hypothetical protein
MGRPISAIPRLFYHAFFGGIDAVRETNMEYFSRISPKNPKNHQNRPKYVIPALKNDLVITTPIFPLTTANLLGEQFSRTEQLIEAACLPSDPCNTEKGHSDPQPRAYADIDPAEIFGGGGDRVPEGEKPDLHCASCFVPSSGQLPSNPSPHTAAQANRDRAAASLARPTSNRPRPSTAVSVGPPQFGLSS